VITPPAAIDGADADAADMAASHAAITPQSSASKQN